jgi:hypothetical protein
LFEDARTFTPLYNFERTISKANAEHLIETYFASVEEIENSLGDHKVLALLRILIREALGAGPSPPSKPMLNGATYSMA